MSQSSLPTQLQNKTNPGTQKASKLLVALGADMSTNIMSQLTPDEVEALTAEIVVLNRIEPDERARLIDECRESLIEKGTIGGADYARKLLQQVFGDAKAAEMFEGIENEAASFIRKLRGVSPRQLAASITQEKPQVIALILGYVPSETAAQVLSTLPEQVQGEVALRLTTMQPTDPEVITKIADILMHKVSTTQSTILTEVGGKKSVVQILNYVDRSTERKILQYLTSVNEQIANEIKESMFVFEDILTLEDRYIQTILRDVPQEDLRLSLKGSMENVKEVFFRNMSQRAAETLKEDLESSGPVKLRDVEAAQGRIAQIARALDEAGEISVRDTGEAVVG